MKKVKRLGTYLLISWLLISCACLLQGCFSDTGFEKRATLVPDRVGISYGEERFKGEDAAWKGFTISAQWDLK